MVLYFRINKLQSAVYTLFSFKLYKHYGGIFMLKEKLEIAKNLRISKTRWSMYSIDTKLIKKCYRTYIIQCIFLGKDKFKLKFKGKHLTSFWKRVCDWLDYIIDNIKKIFILMFIPKKFRPKNKYPYLYYKIYKPIHLKITDAPNEIVLYTYLEENGLKVIEEHLYPVDTVYDIALI